MSQPEDTIRRLKAAPAVYKVPNPGERGPFMLPPWSGRVTKPEVIEKPPIELDIAVPGADAYLDWEADPKNRGKVGT